MDTKPLLFGLIGFFLGGLLVSFAATTFDKPVTEHSSNASMSQMTETLEDKRGDEFDKAFIAAMIEHHEGAIEMAKLSADNASREEVKELSNEIISAQEAEITEMQKWQTAWMHSPAEHNTH